MRRLFRYAIVVGSAILLLAACGGRAGHGGREAASPTPTRLMSDFLIFDDSGLPSRIDVSSLNWRTATTPRGRIFVGWAFCKTAESWVIIEDKGIELTGQAVGSPQWEDRL